MRTVSRRGFLKCSAALAAAMSLPGAGAVAPPSAMGAGREFFHSGGGPESLAGKRVLIAYASMHGSTGDVAGVIGKVLCAAGASVDILPVKQVDDLGPYRAAVIGSAVRSDRWLPEAQEFVASNRVVLSRMPTAYFLTCLTLAVSTAENLQKARSFLDPVREEVPEVRPVGTGLFAGVLDYSQYGAAIHAVMRYKMWAKGIGEGDYRDWQAIRAWADQVKSAILAA